jgi:hypothetical protein
MTATPRSPSHENPHTLWNPKLLSVLTRGRLFNIILPPTPRYPIYIFLSGGDHDNDGGNYHNIKLQTG